MLRLARHAYSFLRSIRQRICYRLPAALFFKSFRLEDYSFLYATKKGLYVTDLNCSQKLMSGCFYGITLHEDAVYVFQSFPECAKGRILKITRGKKVEVWQDGLSEGCHQIDQRDGRLYVTDTYHNRILVFAIDSRQKLAEHYPVGKLTNGRADEAYRHINSILLLEKHVLLLCHNESAKTGKPSSLLICTPDFSLRQELPLNAQSAHNVLFRKDGSLMLCNSLNRAVSDGKKDRLHFEHFTRGMALTDDVLLVGESAYCFGEKRHKANGWINVFSSEAILQKRLAVRGMVQEIRALQVPDYGLSAYCQQEAYESANEKH